MKLSKRLFFTALVACSMAGCASNDPQDPFEGYNRAMFSFNEGLDNAVIKPVAKGYKAVTPSFFRTHVGNFFSNLRDVWGTANAGLQFKGEKFATGLFRVGVNSTFGFGGLVDVASSLGLDRPQEDFGQTLGYWGVKPGPFIVWPVFGPSNVRDTIGMIADGFAYPVAYIDDDGTRWGLVALNGINLRAQLLGVDDVADSAALDKYTFIKNAYMQRRLNMVYDGNPPVDDADYQFEDDEL